jgi:hypothetical protein
MVAVDIILLGKNTTNGMNKLRGQAVAALQVI